AKVEFDEEDTTGESIVPQGADPLTTETTELPMPAPGSDTWLEFAATGTTSSFRIEDQHVRLALIAGEQIARGLGGALDVRVLLHRAATSPVVVLVIGPPPALRVPSPTQLAVLALDVAVDLDRQVLAQLAKTFELVVDVVVRGRPIRRVRLAAPLAENLAYILRAADDHLRGLTADGEAEPSFARARDLVLGAGYDLLGVEHPEHAEFRDDKLAQLQTAQHVRRAIAIAKRFARPSREDYLVTARGFPLVRWRQLRRHVLESAVAWGIWMGPELAQLAVSEGLARSRRDLIVKLDAGFETLRRHPTAFDLDADAADDNAKALADEAKALGVELRRKGGNGAIKSEDVSTVSGSIERTPTQSIPRGRSVDELLGLLDDKKHRVSAAAELCDRGDARAAIPVISAVKKMSRAEAVRILGKTVKLGSAAAGPLIEGLQSSKAFLRHGCALALALLRNDDGTHAVIQLLFDEPTEIWREIARAIGQIGPTALMPLASHVGRLGDRLPQLSERIAWAMAHIGVRGGKTALDQMAAGQSIMAPLAKQALALLEHATRDEVRVRPGQPSKDVTVNRAFSRRFFEALESDRPDVAAAALHDLDASSPQELDDADLIVEEEEAELDESDLIQT
ncbi:MAG: HEAT repeat domain-containing protein, partial [Acidobacteriota bacterium]